MSDRTLLVVCQSRSGSVTRLVEALVAGTRADGIDGVTSVVLPPLDAGPDDVLAADLIVLAGPENFGLINGLMKDFLERAYYPCLDRTVGLPYALVVHGNEDGTGAIRTTEKIVTGLRWKAVQPPLLSVGEVTAQHLAQAEELGATLAGGLSLGLWRPTALAAGRGSGAVSRPRSAARSRRTVPAGPSSRTFRPTSSGSHR